MIIFIKHNNIAIIIHKLQLLNNYNVYTFRQIFCYHCFDFLFTHKLCKKCTSKALWCFNVNQTFFNHNKWEIYCRPTTKTVIVWQPKQHVNMTYITQTSMSSQLPSFLNYPHVAKNIKKILMNSPCTHLVGPCCGAQWEDLYVSTYVAPPAFSPLWLDSGPTGSPYERSSRSCSPPSQSICSMTGCVGQSSSNHRGQSYEVPIKYEF